MNKVQISGEILSVESFEYSGGKTGWNVLIGVPQKAKDAQGDWKTKPQPVETTFFDEPPSRGKHILLYARLSTREHKGRWYSSITADEWVILQPPQPGDAPEEKPADDLNLDDIPF